MSRPCVNGKRKDLKTSLLLRWIWGRISPIRFPILCCEEVNRIFRLVALICFYLLQESLVTLIGMLLGMLVVHLSAGQIHKLPLCSFVQRIFARNRAHHLNLRGKKAQLVRPTEWNPAILPVSSSKALADDELFCLYTNITQDVNPRIGFCRISTSCVDCLFDPYSLARLF